MTTREERSARRWTGRPWAARFVRIVVYVVPFAASVMTAVVLSTVVPGASVWPMAILRLGAIAACSTVALYGVDTATRRLLPLAALLDLTLVFPDEAPSRFKVAMQTGGTKELERRLAEYRRLGADEPARAAELLLGLVAELSRHDRLTRGHSERVRAYSQMIGEELGLDDDCVDKLRWAALLHDIGKLEIPFAILNKPGRLTDEEYEVVKAHPAIGAQLAAPLAGWLGDWVLAVAQHHERWDGTGYPNGLRGPEISYAARIVAVADTFDVMTSVRSYQEAGTAAVARQELAMCAGTQFDPAVVRAFLSISLGKLRMAMGPLSWLTQLSLFPPGLVGSAAAPAVTAATGVAAATLGVIGAPVSAGPVDAPDHVAAEVVEIDTFVDSTTPLVADLGSSDDPLRLGDAPTAAPPGSGTETNSDAPGGAVSAPGAPASTTAIPSTPTSAPHLRSTTPGRVTTTTSPTRLTTTTTAVATVKSTTTTPGPTTTVEHTSTATTTTSTTTATANTVATTTATTTATTATTATTTVPTTTVPSGLTYFLASPAPGDVASQPVLPLVARGPLNAVLPNLDTDRDGKVGLKLKKDGEFLIKDADKLQRFSLDPGDPLVLAGHAYVSLYAGARDLKTDDVQVGVGLVECDDGGSTCTVFATTIVDFKGQKDQFSLVGFDLGVQSRTIPTANHLELWIIATRDSKHDMWLAYDTVGYESSLVLNG